MPVAEITGVGPSIGRSARRVLQRPRRPWLFRRASAEASSGRVRQRIAGGLAFRAQGHREPARAGYLALRKSGKVTLFEFLPRRCRRLLTGLPQIVENLGLTDTADDPSQPSQGRTDAGVRADEDAEGAHAPPDGRHDRPPEGPQGRAGGDQDAEPAALPRSWPRLREGIRRQRPSGRTVAGEQHRLAGVREADQGRWREAHQNSTASGTRAPR